MDEGLSGVQAGSSPYYAPRRRSTTRRILAGEAGRHASKGHRILTEVPEEPPPAPRVPDGATFSAI